MRLLEFAQVDVLAGAEEEVVEAWGEGRGRRIRGSTRGIAVKEGGNGRKDGEDDGADDEGWSLDGEGQPPYGALEVIDYLLNVTYDELRVINEEPLVINV